MAKILLAEDDLFLRDIYLEILADEGFDVTAAVDGSEALSKILEGGWDLVLLDVVMPKVTGIEVLQKIKDQSPKSLAKHIVLMTNSEEAKDVAEVVDMTDGFMLKSEFTPDKFVVEVKKYLN